MRGTDKYLIVFAIAVVVLVVTALIVTARQPEETYRDGDSAEDIAHNYLLALERHDYERAYSYLSPEINAYPEDLRQFIRDVSNMYPRITDSDQVDVLSSVERNDFAWVDVRRTGNYGGGLFGVDRYSNEFELELEKLSTGWKIIGGDYYFSYCWEHGNCE